MCIYKYVHVGGRIIYVHMHLWAYSMLFPATTQCLDSDSVSYFCAYRHCWKSLWSNNILIIVQPKKYIYTFTYNPVWHTSGLMSMVPYGSVASIHCDSSSLAGQKWRMRYSHCECSYSYAYMCVLTQMKLHVCIVRVCMVLLFTWTQLYISLKPHINNKIEIYM